MLVILESPGKIKKMKSILGAGYSVAASVGHICDLDPKTLSIEVVNDGEAFVPIYKTLAGKQKVIQSIRKLRTDGVILATDQDREGEFIAHSLREILGLQDPVRIRFNQITRDAIQTALQNPGRINEDLVSAQKARRVMDRLVGYLISPLLGKGRSAGRVQSVVVKMIFTREMLVEEALRNIKTTVNVQGVFESPKLKGTMLRPSPPNSHEEAERVLHMLFHEDRAPFSVTKVEYTEESRTPPPAYTTSSLQQDAWVRLRLSSEKTMKIAQQLYESGHITYHRTDSTTISPEGMKKAKDFIVKEYGVEYSSPRAWGSPNHSNLEAHEAIRVTDPWFTGKDEISTESHLKLYRLIWVRTLQSQMMAARFEIQRIILERSGFVFETTARKILFQGFLILSGEQSKDEFHSVNKGDLLYIVRADAIEEVKNIASHFQESSLIKEMETLSIGRPSTYASILKLIQTRGYVKIKDPQGVPFQVRNLSYDRVNGLVTKEKSIMVGAEKKRFLVTDVGKEITTYLNQHFGQLMDVGYTASMEEKLDRVARGQASWQDVIREVYHTIKRTLPTPLNSSRHLILGEKDGKKYTYMPQSAYTPCVRVDYGNNITTFIPIPEEHKGDVTLEHAVLWGGTQRLLGTFRGLPIFVVKGKYGYFLKHGKKRIPLRNHADISLDLAKKVIQA